MPTQLDQCPHCRARLPRRAEYISPSYGRESVFGVTAFISGYGAAFFFLFHVAWPPSLWPWTVTRIPYLLAGAVMFGLWLSVEGILITTLYWLLERGQARPVDDDSRVTFAPTGPHSLRRLPAGVTEHRLWQYLVAVALEEVTLSQRGAAEYGFSQRQANEIKEWCIAVGWYEVLSTGNAYGQWTREGRRVLGMLAQHPPALWGEIINPPTAGDVSPPDRAVLDQHARPSTGEEVGRGELYELTPWGDNDD